MPVYALGDRVPDIHPTAYVHPDAVIIGSVTLAAESSIWPGAVLRGDGGEIHIGARSSIQDNSVLHTIPENWTVVGEDCVVGHLVHLEGCTIEDACLIGNASVVLHRVIVRTGSIVAANAVLLDDTEVPSGAIAAGIPATIRPGKAKAEMIAAGARHYVENGATYRAHLRRLD